MIAMLVPVGLGLFANGVTVDKVCGSSGGSHQQIFYNNPPSSFDGSNTWDSITWTISNATQGQYNDGEFTGKTVTKVQFWLMATNATAYPSGGHIDGLVHAYVFDPNGNIVYDFGTVDASTLTPNDNTGNPASLPVSLVTFTGSHTMLANETIGYRYENGTSNQYQINNFANYAAPASQY